jgi:hypothetical protein
MRTRQSTVKTAWRIQKAEAKAALLEFSLDSSTTAGISNADARTEQSWAASINVGARKTGWGGESERDSTSASE